MLLGISVSTSKTSYNLLHVQLDQNQTQTQASVAEAQGNDTV